MPAFEARLFLELDGNSSLSLMWAIQLCSMVLIPAMAA